jgi:hypothetical protein
MSFTKWHLLSLEQQSGALCACPSPSLVKQVCVSAQEQIQQHGGITARVFAHAIVPLLMQQSGTGDVTDSQLAAFAGLVPLRRYSVAPDEKNDVETIINSAATRCATDPLCLAFSYLYVSEFLVAQRVCRAWRAIRLHSSSWPSAGNIYVYAHSLSLDESSIVQLYALRGLHSEMLSTHTSYFFFQSLFEKLVQLIQSPDADLQLASVRVLALFKGRESGDRPMVSHLIRCNGIDVLIPLLHASNSTAIKCAAVYTLGTIAGVCERHPLAAFGNKLVLRLLELFADRQSDLILLRGAARLLLILCERESHSSLMNSVLPAVTRLLLYTKDDELLAFACLTLACFANSNMSAATVQVDTSVVVRRFMGLFQHKNNNVVVSATIAAADFAQGDDAQKQVMVDCGILPRVVTLLTHAEKDVRTQACRIVSNLSEENRIADDALFSCGIIPELARILQTETKVAVQMFAVRAIYNVSTRASEVQTHYLEQNGVIPPLCTLLGSSSLRIINLTLHAMSCYLAFPNSTSHSDRIMAMIRHGAIPHIIYVLEKQQYDYSDIRWHALSIVNRMISSDDAIPTQAFVDGGILPCLLTLLAHKDAFIREQACLAIRNIAADGEMSIDAIIAADIIPRLLCILDKDEAGVQKQAAIVICTATSLGNEKHIDYLLAVGLLQHLCAMMRTHQDNQTLCYALEGLDRILQDRHNVCAGMMQQCGGVELIQALQQHTFSDVQELARDILADHFDLASNNTTNKEDELMPASDDTQQQ